MTHQHVTAEGGHGLPVHGVKAGLVPRPRHPPPPPPPRLSTRRLHLHLHPLAVIQPVDLHLLPHRHSINAQLLSVAAGPQQQAAASLVDDAPRSPPHCPAAPSIVGSATVTRPACLSLTTSTTTRACAAVIGRIDRRRPAKRLLHSRRPLHLRLASIVSASPAPVFITPT